MPNTPSTAPAYKIVVNPVSSFRSAAEQTLKPKKAMAIRPAVTRLMGKPFMHAGILLLSSRSRTPAIRTMGQQEAQRAERAVHHAVNQVELLRHVERRHAQPRNA